MKNEIRFDEGFDNILIYDYDAEYRQGPMITGDTWMDTGNRETRSLDGDWHFCPDVFHSVVRSRWFDETKENRDGRQIPYDFSFEEWGEIRVPGVWNHQRKEYALYEGPGLYFKEFEYPGKCGRRVFLKIGAANYETRIWLNRKYLGRHLGGFTPFCVEVTEYLEEKNRLLVCVDNTRKGEMIPSLHYDWFNYGGIHRTVELAEVPEVFIQNYMVQLSGEEKNQIEYVVTVGCGRGYDWEKYRDDRVEAVIRIDELGIREQVVCRLVNEAGKLRYEGTGKIPVEEDAMHLWSPDRPYLYQVRMECGEDVLEEEIGFRRMETRGRDIVLNGKSVFLRGMCVHEESPEHLRAVTMEDMERTLRTAKELGCNFLRLTHYPHNEWMAKLADRLGIMLLEEIPVYWALEFENPETYRDAANQLTELILRDRNRASVIIWSVGNENPDTDARYEFMKKLAGLARSLDGSRLIGAACLIDVETCQIRDRLMAELDVVGINEYYGWYIRDFGTLKRILDGYEAEKPMVITETGADAVCGMFGDAEEIYTEECQAAVYQKQFELLFQYPFIRGTTPWILFDYASMRRMSHLQKGYNLKGIMGADHTYRKKAYAVVKEAYRRKKEMEEEREEGGKNDRA